MVDIVIESFVFNIVLNMFDCVKYPYMDSNIHLSKGPAYGVYISRHLGDFTLRLTLLD